MKKFMASAVLGLSLILVSGLMVYSIRQPLSTTMPSTSTMDNLSVSQVRSNKDKADSPSDEPRPNEIVTYQGNNATQAIDFYAEQVIKGKLHLKKTTIHRMYDEKGELSDVFASIHLQP